MKRIALALVAALAVTAFALESFELKRTEAAGRVQKYTVAMDFDAESMSGDFSATVTTTVESVDGAGVAKVKHEMADGLVNVSGQQMARDLPTYTATVGGDNAVRKVEGENVTPTILRFVRAINPVFPTGPSEVKDGIASWTVDVAADGEQGTPAWKGTGKFVGKEVQSGEECLKLEYDLAEGEGDLPIKSKGTAWVRPTDGTMVKLSFDVQNLPVEGFVMNAKYNVTLVK